MTPIRERLEQARQQWQVRPLRRGMSLLWHATASTLLILLATGCVYAQAAAEYGGATSGIAASISKTNVMKDVRIPDVSGNKSAVIMSKPSKNSAVNKNYIFDSMKQGSVEANRKALEDGAGKNAAKLMLRSKPTHANVKIDGKPVGKTPILLVLAPGQYDVAMTGKRMDHGEQKVDLLPKETREFMLPLKQVYPTAVRIQLH